MGLNVQGASLSHTVLTVVLLKVRRAWHGLHHIFGDNFPAEMNHLVSGLYNGLQSLGAPSGRPSLLFLNVQAAAGLIFSMRTEVCLQA